MLFFYKFDDITDFTIQCIAKSVQRFCVDGFAFFHAMEGVGGKTLLINQIVFRDSF